MPQPPQTPPLFRTSLRDWLAAWKARRAERPAGQAEPAPPRVKRLAARKRLRQRGGGK